MKTCMLGKAQRIRLTSSWPLAVAQGVVDEEGALLSPGDLVRLPACVRWSREEDWDAPGIVLGLALGKDGSPSIVVDALAWGRGRPDSWRTWIVNGIYCNRIGEGEATRLSLRLAGRGFEATKADHLLEDSESRSFIRDAWLQIMAGGVRTKGGVAIQPGDLVRLPRNVARNRRSQLHAAGTCLGYAVGMDGSPCAVADAVGEDAPTLTRWRTWLVRGSESLVIDTREAWRLESRYASDGRLRAKA